MYTHSHRTHARTHRQHARALGALDRRPQSPEVDTDRAEAAEEGQAEAARAEAAPLLGHQHLGGEVDAVWFGSFVCFVAVSVVVVETGCDHVHTWSPIHTRHVPVHTHLGSDGSTASTASSTGIPSSKPSSCASASSAAAFFLFLLPPPPPPPSPFPNPFC